MKKILTTLMVTMMAMATYAAGNDSSEDIMLGVFVVLFAIIAFAVVIGLYVLVAVMAKKRNRNIALWVLLSFFGSPVLIAIILLIVGDSEKDELSNFA